MLTSRARTGLILSLAAGLISVTAKAYDVDTHFYGTYAMARFAGIGPDVAAKLATSAQWMDESYLSDPTSMIIMPVTGIAKRRLLHFPASRVVGILAGSIRDESFGLKEPTGLERVIAELVIKVTQFKGDQRALAINSQTEPNHEFANALIMQGLKEGNLMKAGTGLHTLEDSYAHAGTAPIEGHAQVWHWPDRPFAAVKKYYKMTATVFKAMVAIRQQLPKDMLDCSKTTYGPRPNCELSAEELQYAYSNIPNVVNTVKYNVLKDSRYIRKALHDMLNRALVLNYFTADTLPDHTSLDQLLDDSVNSMMLIGRVDAYAILANFINKVIAVETNSESRIINRELLARDMGLVTDPNISMDDLILSQSTALEGRLDGLDPTHGRLTFEHMIALRLLSGYVPIPLSDTHRVEKEDDEAVTRKFEMKLRIENMQKLVFDLFGENIEFVANSTATDDGFALEVLKEPGAETTFKRVKPDTTYITFSALEKRRFDMMIFGYLFPHLTDANLTNLVMALREAKQVSAMKLPKSAYPIAPAIYTTVYTKTAYDCVTAIAPMLNPFLNDLFNAHLVPLGDEKFYQVPELLTRFKVEPRNAKLFPQFLGEKDTWVRNVKASGLMFTEKATPPISL